MLVQSGCFSQQNAGVSFHLLANKRERKKEREEQ
jgi:hypothetical protein